MYVVNNFNCRGFGPLLEDKLCLIFKLAPSVCRMTFPILASLLVRLVVLLPFQLLRLSLATPSRWTPLALSVFLHCVVALLLTLSDKGKDTRDYLAAAFPALNAWERAGADASSAGMVDAGFENQKELTKMQLDNQKEIAEMQNETQKEIAGIQSATSRQNTKDQV